MPRSPFLHAPQLSSQCSHRLGAKVTEGRGGSIKIRSSPHGLSSFLIFFRCLLFPSARTKMPSKRKKNKRRMRREVNGGRRA